MEFNTLIRVHNLFDHLNDADWAVFDCRFTLGDPQRGENDYMRGHIPGAIYAHLDDDLCSTIIPGTTGRHPLPSIEQMVEKLSEWGVDSGMQVVAYDDWPQVGLPVAARLWWMLRYLGHRKVCVLEGGWRRWVSSGLPEQTSVESRPKRLFAANIRPELLASSREMDEMRQDYRYRVVDARSQDRYRGENETIDPVAGHIPGAISLPFTGNITPDGDFLSQADLRVKYKESFGDVPADRITFYCGSGVTAAVNVLALAHAGLGDARLYAGSWSEWITDPARPVE